MEPRTLNRGHFAFMRALLQGLDERESWDRYLRQGDETVDLRKVRSTIASKDYAKRLRWWSWSHLGPVAAVRSAGGQELARPPSPHASST